MKNLFGILILIFVFTSCKKGDEAAPRINSTSSTGVGNGGILPEYYIIVSDGIITDTISAIITRDLPYNSTSGFTQYQANGHILVSYSGAEITFSMPHDSIGLGNFPLGTYGIVDYDSIYWANIQRYTAITHGRLGFKRYEKGGVIYKSSSINNSKNYHTIISKEYLNTVIDYDNDNNSYNKKNFIVMGEGNCEAIYQTITKEFSFKYRLIADSYHKNY